MLPKYRSGDTETWRDRKSDSAQADKTLCFWPNRLIINELSGVQWNNFSLVNNKNSLQLMHSFERLQDHCYTAIINEHDSFRMKKSMKESFYENKH